MENKDYLDEIKDTDGLLEAIHEDEKELNNEKELLKLKYERQADDIKAYLSNPYLSNYYTDANPYESMEPEKVVVYKSNWGRIKANFKKMFLK